jgi:hypothetical protein
MQDLIRKTGALQGTPFRSWVPTKRQNGIRNKYERTFIWEKISTLKEVSNSWLNSPLKNKAMILIGKGKLTHFDTGT